MSKLKKFFYRDKPLINRMFRNLLVVMVLAAFLTSLTNLISITFVSVFYDNDGVGVAATSLAFTSLGLVNVILAIFTTGTQAKTAGAMANVDRKSANQFVTAGIILSIVFGILFFFIGFFGARVIAFSLAANKSAAIQNETTLFLKGMAIMMPIYILNSVLRSVATLDGDRTLVFGSLISIILVAIICNLLNAYVYNGGIFGVAISTSFGYIISTLILIFHFFRKKALLKFSFKLFNLKTSIILIKRGMVNAVKALVTSLFELFANYVLLTVGGPSALTILGIQAGCFSIVNSLISGFYDCGFILNHVFSAEEDNKAIYDLATLLYKFVFLFVFPISILFIILAPQIASTYEPNPNDVESVIIAIRCSIAACPFLALQTIAIVFMPLKNCNIAFILQIFIFPIIFCSIFVSTIGINGFWIGKAIGVSFYIPVHLLWATIKYKHFPKNIIEAYFLPNNFGYQQEFTLRARIKSYDDGNKLISDADSFCNRLKLSVDVKNRVTTILESLIKIYDLLKLVGNNKHFVEVLIFYKEGNVNIRLRDNSDFNLNDDGSEYVTNKIYYESATKIRDSLSKLNFINVLNITNYLFTVKN